jgi:hypothetical protein
VGLSLEVGYLGVVGLEGLCGVKIFPTREISL